ncbi:DUF4148 domain-containing protein [Caenimonas terrae]|uniref:DUF4148 domain-containing protein n=1 Tax=Caenimonas terrae TaxID=696074 RepID=A0ABW0N7X3_9BURK
MNASKFAAVSTFALLAAFANVAAHADEADGSQYAGQATGQRTRAEVKAEAVAATGDRSQDLAALGNVAVHSTTTRAEVRAQAAKALRLGQISSGEAGAM